MKNPKIPATAFSYVRFSSPKQREGDSLRRQTQAAAEWCARNKVPLDTSLTLHDKGCSAFRGMHRDNPDKHALALFLKLVERGRVRPGDYLLVENLDRLSREHIQPAMLLVLNLLQAGVRIVQLKPSEMVFDDRSDALPVMMMMVELSRGHSESAMKSSRVGAEWKARREQMRSKGVVLTRNLPAWVEEHDGKLRLIPGRAAVVRRVFQLAAAGYGHQRIAQTLTREKVPPFGSFEEYTVRDEATGKEEVRRRAPAGERLGSGQWTRAYIYRILSDRRAAGEYQPLLDDGTPDGPALPDYFPWVVTVEEWYAARAGAARRGAANGHKTNGSSKHVDVFAGLVKDARDGGAVYCVTRSAAGKHTRVLVNANGREGRVRVVSFPYTTFERGVCSLLREVRAADALGVDDAPAEAAVLEGEKAQVERELAGARAYLKSNGFSPTIADHIIGLEKRLAEVGERLSLANQRAAHPLAESWGEARGLMGGLDKAKDPDDARLRLRTALRRAVEDIRVLFVSRGLVRLAAAQIFFTGGACRSYLILHRHALRGVAGKRPEAWQARSMADVVKEGSLDLRRLDHARHLEQALGELDPADLENGD
jgi:DNA invertase Pin-like site-specific DNA recombinase